MFTSSYKIYGQKNSKVVIVFAGWGVRQWHLWLLGQLFTSYGFKAIILTWDKTLLTTDPGLTVQHFMSVKINVWKL